MARTNLGLVVVFPCIRSVTNVSFFSLSLSLYWMSMCDWADFSSFPTPAEQPAIIGLKRINENTSAINLYVCVALPNQPWHLFHGKTSRGKSWQSRWSHLLRLELSTKSIEGKYVTISTIPHGISQHAKEQNETIIAGNCNACKRRGKEKCPLVLSSVAISGCHIYLY